MSLKNARRVMHNTIALMFLFVPMVLFGQALFSYAATGVSATNESIANKRIASEQVRSQHAVLFEEGIISITFDDGWKNVATNAAPILAEYKIASTQYVIGNSIGARGYMSVGQLKAMKSAGHQIASHGMTHVPLAKHDSSDVEREFRDSKKRLIDLKLIENDDEVDFAYPYGSRSTETNRIGAPVYRSLRGAVSGLNNGVHPQDINTRETFRATSTFIGMTIDSGTPLTEIQNAIKYAKANKGWLVLNFHQIDDDDSEFAVSKETLRKIIKIIMDENIKTMTVEDALGTYKEAR